jgi:hypothetical protein
MALELLFTLVQALASRPGEDPALARGLAAIEARNIEADLYFIADDALRGRDTPSPEQRVAARFLAARLARIGLQPAGEDGTYFDRYTLGFTRLDRERSALVLTEGGAERRLAFGTDYYLGTPSDAGVLDVEGEVVYVGAGSAEDFEQVGDERLAGRWALCRDVGRRALQRRNAARERGALGLLVTPGEDYELEAYPERHRPVTETLTTGRIQRGGGGRDEQEETPYPQVYLSPEVGAALLHGRRVGDVLPLRVREMRAADSVVELENVCALWPGDDPALASEALIVSAHYDHVGTRRGEVYNGADDNGSGTSGLLAVAEALVAHGPLRRSVLLIWVSGEEKGLFGSAAWAADPTLPAGMRPVCDVNIDMIGRNAPARLGITPSESHPKANSLAAMARELAPLEGFPTLESADDYYERSDQANFAELGIPVCFFFSGEHEDYHQPTDTADKIDYDKVERVARLVFRMLVRLESASL